MKFKYNHVKKEFDDIVSDAFPKLFILDYYPYGKKTNWKYWLCGEVNLKKEYLAERNKHRNEWDYVFLIIEETARAMNYLMTSGNNDWFDAQRIQAFALWKLFHCGDVGWSKKNLKGLTLEQKIKYYMKCNKESNKLTGDLSGYGVPKLSTEEERKLAISNVNKHGVYEVRHKPLIQYSNTVCGKRPKILYTKQELAAINLMVTCAFENLC